MMERGMGPLVPKDFETMCNDDIVLEMVKLFKNDSWNEDKNFKYLVLKKDLYEAIKREEGSTDESRNVSTS